MIILDTHIWVWWNQDSPQLTEFYKEVIENSRADVMRYSLIFLIFDFYFMSENKVYLITSGSAVSDFSTPVERSNFIVVGKRRCRGYGIIKDLAISTKSFWFPAFMPIVYCTPFCRQVKVESEQFAPHLASTK